MGEGGGGRGGVGDERDVCKERSRASPGYELQVRSNGDRDLAGGNITDRERETSSHLTSGRQH